MSAHESKRKARTEWGLFLDRHRYAQAAKLEDLKVENARLRDELAHAPPLQTLQAKAAGAK